MTAARRALLRDMSAAWIEVNTVLQQMAHASSQGIYGKGRPRERSGPRKAEEESDLE